MCQAAGAAGALARWGRFLGRLALGVVSVACRLVLGPLPPVTRLTLEEVLALAAEAVRTSERGQELNSWGLSMAVLNVVDGRVTWWVRTPTVGSGFCVTVDDATGEVGELRRWGVR